jgi:aminopeptidase 2
MPVVSEKPFTIPPEDDPSVSKLAKAFSKLSTSDSETKWKITKFATTPLISSYLVAWANGPFEFIEGSYTSPLSGKTRPVRIYGAVHAFQLAFTFLTDFI